MKLYMKQKVFSWSDQFTVKDEYEQDRFYVRGKFLSWGKKLFVYDAQENQIAYLHQKMLSFMPRYIVDIGGVEAFQIAQRFTVLSQRFDMDGLPWRVEGDFWAHEYTVYDGEREVMHISRRWLSWGDSYELDIVDPQDELPCLCVVLAIDAAMQDNDAATSAATT